MTDVLVGLPVAALVALVLGGGWAVVLRRMAPRGVLGLLFLSWTLATIELGVVWAWAYPLGLHVQAGIILSLLAAVAGYGVAGARGDLGAVRREVRGTGKSLWGLVLPFVVVVVATIPAMAGINQLSVGLRVGPDAIGYAISAQAIGSGATASAVEHQALRQAGGGTAIHVISPGTKLIDTTPSFTTQVRAEFLTGAGRWAVAGVVGSIIYLIGADYLWSGLSLLAALALFVACVGVWAVVRELSGRIWPAVVATILLGLSSMVLDAWHEGAIAGIWVFPACLLLAIPLLRLGELSPTLSAGSIALGLAGLLSAYNDALFTYGAVFGLAAVLSIPMLRRRWWSTWWPLAAGAGAGALLVGPSTLSFGQWLPTSIREPGGAGWSQARWPSLAEAFGLHNPYTTSVPGVGARSGGENVVDGLEDALVAGFLIGLVYRKLCRPAVVLLVSVMGVCLFVYLQTRYVTHANNYQYFKSIAILAPAGALGVGRLLGDAMPEPRRRAAAWCSFVPGAVPLTSFVVAIAVAAAGISYVVTYKREGTVVPTAYNGLAVSPRAAVVFDRYNVLAPTQPSALLGEAVGAEVNLNWIGRNLGAPPTRLGRRVADPVALLVSEPNCPGFRCLAGLRRGAVVFRGDGVALVRLSDTTTALARLPETQWSTWAEARFASEGGRPLVQMIPR